MVKFNIYSQRDNDKSQNDIFPDFETAKKLTIGEAIALDFNEKQMDGLKRIRANKLTSRIKDFISNNIVYIKYDKELKEYYRYALKFKKNRIVIDWNTQKVESSIKKNGYICLLDNQIIANPKNHAEEYLLNQGLRNPEVISEKPIKTTIKSTKSSKKTKPKEQSYIEKEKEMLDSFKHDLFETEILIPIWNKRDPTEFGGNIYDFLGHLDTEITRAQNQIDTIKMKIRTELKPTSKTENFTKKIDKLKQDLTNLKDAIHSKYEIKPKQRSR